MAGEEETTPGQGEGTYTLAVAFDGSATVEVGALGSIDFDAGWYAYTGSAFGPGGFARVERHRELAGGERDVRHWHVDYLLGHPDASIVSVAVTENEDRECEIARRLSQNFEPVAGLGASDCDCETHLAYSGSQRLLDEVNERHG